MEKLELYQEIEKNSGTICALSDEIWDYAELSLLEYKSAAAFVRVLKQEGFQVEEQVCGIPTAFTGSFGSGSPRIGILGEFDALSGLSQESGNSDKVPLEADGNGHGCGHNLLGAGALGAAIAVKNAIAAGKLKGTVVFYGCPGEEGCAGKTFMARDGMFKDLDAAITWHPGTTNAVTQGSNAACIQVAYAFSGTAAHAAGNPWAGRSALDAAELMNIGVQFLREHMEPKCSVHYSIADGGGMSPNVVQPKAKLIYMIRAEIVKKAKALWERVNKIAQGAAMMTETTVTSYQIDGTADTLSNTVLEEVLQQNLQEAPMPDYDEKDWAFAAALRKTYPSDKIPGEDSDNPKLKAQLRQLSDNGKKDILNFVIPYYPANPYSPGSTDVGDVSHLTPTAQFTTATWTSGVPGHSWQVVATGKTEIAHKGMLYAAKVLAGAAADLMENPQLLEKAREEFSVTGADGYDCPIGPELKAAPQG